MSAPKIQANAGTGTQEVPEVTGYDSDLRFYATRYKQGSRTVYSLDLSLDQVATLIPEPDPKRPTEGNRAIRPAHAADFGKYIRHHEEWISPAMLLRAPDMFSFEVKMEVAGAEFGILSFSRLSMFELNILDGQHRILGTHLAFKGINDDLDRARSNLAAARRVDPDGKAAADFRAQIVELQRQRERLGRERISIQVYVEEDSTAYKQMFFDIADNALGITASVRSRFDSRKVVNRALPLTMDHPLLAGRVDEEGDRTGRGSPYMMASKHVAEIIRTVKVGLDGRVSKRQEDEFDEKEMAAQAKSFFSLLVKSFEDMRALPLEQSTPDQLRRTSLLGSVLFVRILGGVYHDLINEHAFSEEMVGAFFEKLAPHLSGPVYPGSIWLEHTENWSDGAFSPRSSRQDLRSLKNTLVGWAITRPDFLDEEPKPRPSDDDLMLDLTEEEAEDILRPEIARARKAIAKA